VHANSLFGQAGLQYDFSKVDIGQLKDRARTRRAAEGHEETGEPEGDEHDRYVCALGSLHLRIPPPDVS